MNKSKLVKLVLMACGIFVSNSCVVSFKTFANTTVKQKTIIEVGTNAEIIDLYKHFSFDKFKKEITEDLVDSPESDPDGSFMEIINQLQSKDFTDDLKNIMTSNRIAFEEFLRNNKQNNNVDNIKSYSNLIGFQKELSKFVKERVEKIKELKLSPLIEKLLIGLNKNRERYYNEYFLDRWVVLQNRVEGSKIIKISDPREVDMTIEDYVKRCRAMGVVVKDGKLKLATYKLSSFLTVLDRIFAIGNSLLLDRGDFKDYNKRIYYFVTKVLDSVYWHCYSFIRQSLGMTGSYISRADADIFNWCSSHVQSEEAKDVLKKIQEIKLDLRRVYEDVYYVTDVMSGEGYLSKLCKEIASVKDNNLSEEDKKIVLYYKVCKVWNCIGRITHNKLKFIKTREDLKKNIDDMNYVDNSNDNSTDSSKSNDDPLSEYKSDMKNRYAEFEKKLDELAKNFDDIKNEPNKIQELINKIKGLGVSYEERVYAPVPKALGAGLSNEKYMKLVNFGRELQKKVANEVEKLIGRVSGQASLDNYSSNGSYNKEKLAVLDKLLKRSKEIEPTSNVDVNTALMQFNGEDTATFCAAHMLMCYLVQKNLVSSNVNYNDVNSDYDKIFTDVADANLIRAAMKSLGLSFNHFIRLFFAFKCNFFDMSFVKKEGSENEQTKIDFFMMLFNRIFKSSEGNPFEVLGQYGGLDGALFYMLQNFCYNLISSGQLTYSKDTKDIKFSNVDDKNLVKAIVSELKLDFNSFVGCVVEGGGNFFTVDCVRKIGDADLSKNDSVKDAKFSEKEEILGDLLERLCGTRCNQAMINKYDGIDDAIFNVSVMLFNGLSNNGYITVNCLNCEVAFDNESDKKLLVKAIQEILGLDFYSFVVCCVNSHGRLFEMKYVKKANKEVNSDGEKKKSDDPEDLRTKLNILKKANKALREKFEKLNDTVKRSKTFVGKRKQ